MPYIDKPTREAIASGAPPGNVGALTYVLTLAAIGYVDAQGRSFQTFAAACWPPSTPRRESSTGDR